jgi:bifunctional non-homologous end joining protein LigD
MLAFKADGSVRLVSRQGLDHTARFADIAAAVAKLPALILDGEVCVFDAQLVSQFHLLGDERPEEDPTPPVYIAFDLLQALGRDTRPQPLSYRRPALEDAIAGSRLVLPAKRLDGDGMGAWDEVKRNGWEGLVAKDDSSRYVTGTTRSSLKVKSLTRAASSSLASTCPSRAPARYS